MAVQHGLQVLAAVAAAAVTTGVLTGRWWRTRARRHSGHGADAARAPWSRATSSGAGAVHDRGVGPHAAFLDLPGNQALRTADAHLERYWASIAPLYPRSDTGRAQN
ncbi:hypothetical protein [Streptomyces sp. NRRL F-2580]|uniref:hypothetical protein n=1 Tax=Streptomyces sp. NRRL F-2580 TaxID=1463841 RepID=UPI0004CB603B|nr:hypothetical protein [Streptomyces sp. NRRL F-2580]